MTKKKQVKTAKNTPTSTDDKPMKTTAKKTAKHDKNTETTERDNSADKIKDLEQQLTQAQDSAKENWQRLLRLQAELENNNRRHSKELEKAHKYALDKFVKELLSVSDSLQMGIKTAVDNSTDTSSIVAGIEMTAKLFSDTLTRFGVDEVNPVDEAFNPEQHEAVTIIPIEGKTANSVIEVVQLGYTLNGRLIRPARVVVAQ